MDIKKRRTFMIIGVFLILILVIIFIGRAYLRQQVIPVYASFVYMPQVNETFHETFPSLASHVKALGYTNFTVDLDSCLNGDGVAYGLIFETVHCLKEEVSKPILINSPEATQWPNSIPKLDQYLTKNGWNNNAKQNYIKVKGQYVLENTTNLNYSKTTHGVTCTLYTRYAIFIPDLKWDTNSFAMGEECEYNFKLFGGY